MSRMDDIRKEYAIQQEKERHLEFLRGIEGTPFRKLSLAQMQYLKDNHPLLYERSKEHSEEPVRNLLYLDKAMQKKKEINAMPIIVKNQKEEEKESEVKGEEEVNPQDAALVENWINGINFDSLLP